MDQASNPISNLDGDRHQVFAKKHEPYPVVYNLAADSQHHVRFLRRDRRRRHNTVEEM